MSRAVHNFETLSSGTEFDPQEVLETGERIALEQYNSVFHSNERHPGHVFKVFYRTPESEVRDNISDAELSSFPESEVITTDLSDYGFEEDATVVVQEKSDYSIVEAPKNYHNVDQVYKDVTEVMDEIVSMGMIHNSGPNLSELKLEEFHYFGPELKYVDFEDSNAFNKFPDDYFNNDNDLEEAKEDIGRNYQRLAYQLSDEFGDDLDRVKKIIGEESEKVEYDKSSAIQDSIKEYPFK